MKSFIDSIFLMFAFVAGGGVFLLSMLCGWWWFTAFLTLCGAIGWWIGTKAVAC